jgi:hypothetical protein
MAQQLSSLSRIRIFPIQAKTRRRQLLLLCRLQPRCHAEAAFLRADTRQETVHRRLSLEQFRTLPGASRQAPLNLEMANLTDYERTDGAHFHQ